jgi:hypothetical protein
MTIINLNFFVSRPSDTPKFGNFSDTSCLKISTSKTIDRPGFHGIVGPICTGKSESSDLLPTERQRAMIEAIIIYFYGHPTISLAAS